MSGVTPTDTLCSHLADAVSREADAIRERAIEAAVQKFEVDLREAVLKQAVNLTNYYDISRYGSNVVLTVRHL